MKRQQIGWKFNSEGLRHHRKIRNLSLQKVANMLQERYKIKITRQALCNIENNKTIYPCIPVLLGLSKIFNENYLQTNSSEFAWFIENKRKDVKNEKEIS